MGPDKKEPSLRENYEFAITNTLELLKYDINALEKELLKTPKNTDAIKIFRENIDNLLCHAIDNIK